MRCGNTSMMETAITWCSYWVKIHSLLSLWLRNSTQYNWEKSSTQVNHDNDETPTRKPFIPRRKHNYLGFDLGIKRLLYLSLITTIGKTATNKRSEQIWNLQTFLTSMVKQSKPIPNKVLSRLAGDISSFVCTNKISFLNLQ